MDFRLLLGGFLAITAPNAVEFFWNLEQSCSTRQSITYDTVFDIVLKIPGNGAEKPIFWLFLRDFLTTPSYSLRVTPQFFAKSKVLWWYIIMVSFISLAFVVPKLKIFKCFHGNCSSHKMGPSWVFLGPFFPKYSSNLSKFGPEVAHHKRRTGCECFKIRCLSTNRIYPKSSFLVHFWAQFTPGKRNILSKTKIFPETASLGLSDDTSPKSQINHRILIKIIKKTPHFLSPKWA